jgi:hypothetical protein
MPINALKAAIREPKTPPQLKRAMRRIVREKEGRLDEKFFQIRFCQFLQRQNKKNRGSLVIPELREIRFRAGSMALGIDVAEITEANELISYEIKIGRDAAFYNGMGEAIRNLLFSHRSYIVYEPTESTFYLSDIKDTVKGATKLGLYIFRKNGRIKFERKLKAPRNTPVGAGVKRSLQAIKRIAPRLKYNLSKYASWGYWRCCVACEIRGKCRTTRRGKNPVR